MIEIQKKKLSLFLFVGNSLIKKFSDKCLKVVCWFSNSMVQCTNGGFE
ncbi:hypothetical protein NC99_14400 [Sunxiuqinia dokdonensis]|uniref:Uncharacterized protein n=1 Tax=Sunxiuqinia dokdonensis TaxID=1409788 RepID=A0A0L8VB98_9BACT|nr:hypothetical protein NC99_14400 [Sunxiuqinia dokdonensis]